MAQGKKRSSSAARADASALGCLANGAIMLGIAVSIIAFSALAGGLLARIRGGGQEDGLAQMPYSVSVPGTLAMLVLLLACVEVVGRRQAKYASPIPLWVRGTGLIPMLFLIPLMLAGGPPRPDSHFTHAATPLEYGVVLCGAVIGIAPILAMIGGRWLPLITFHGLWIAWAATVLAKVYWPGIPLCVLVIAVGVALMWQQDRRRTAEPGKPARRKPARSKAALGR